MALTGCLWLIEAAETEVSRCPSSDEKFFFVHRTHIADGERGVATEFLCGDMVSYVHFPAHGLFVAHIEIAKLC